MKPTASSLRFCVLPLIIALASTPLLVAQTTYVWGNGAGTSVINTAENWNPVGVPTSTSTEGSSDTARWDGTAGGNLTLGFTGSLGGAGGTAGINLDVTAGQTGSLSITANTIRVQDITIAAGAGAVALGPVQIGGRSATTAHVITNNSAHNVVQGVLLKGGGGTRNITFTGTGDYTINGAINSNSGDNGFNIAKSGSGTLFLNADSTGWNSTLTVNSGAVRITHANALGSVGSGVIGITSVSGSTNNGRLDLAGGISVAENINLNAKNTGIGAHLRNVSGDNFLTGNIVWNTGGLVYGVRSDAGTLTIAGAVNPMGASKTLTVEGAGDVEFSSAIANTASGGSTLTLEKSGNGVLTLAGANTYTGLTKVTGGTLLVNNALGAGGVDVSAGATLGGSGAIAGQVNVTGILSPGTSIATFASGGLSFADGSTYQYEIDSGVGIGSAADLQIVTGNLDLAGTTTLTLTDIATGSVPVAQGTAFSLLNYTGSWNGGLFTFAGDELANNAYFTAGSNTWEIIYDADSGGANVAGEQVAGSFVNIVAVPEPAAAMLGALGGLLALRRRRA